MAGFLEMRIVTGLVMINPQAWRCDQQQQQQQQQQRWSAAAAAAALFKIQ